jgi:mRNA interferase RelE/StbE
VTRIRSLARDPRPFGSEKLSEREDLYRLRVGRYRVLYSVGDAELVVLIVRVGHRKDVYR